MQRADLTASALKAQAYPIEKSKLSRSLARVASPLTGLCLLLLSGCGGDSAAKIVSSSSLAGTTAAGTFQESAFPLIGVWGSSGNDVFAVGVAGSILHYNGSVWSSMSSGTTSWLRGLWGSSGNDVFAVGTDGAILHYNGLAWSTMNSGTTRWLRGVWGTSGSDVFVVGQGGTILHWNGDAWSTMISGTSAYLLEVWGRSGSDVFAVGSEGTILHYDGNAWSPMVTGSKEVLLDVWGSTYGDMYAVGYAGTILHSKIRTGASPPPTGQLPVDLGSATNFAVLGASTVTNTGYAFIDGDIGVWPGSGVTGFSSLAKVNGTIHAGDAAAQEAQASLTAAYNDAAGRTSGVVGLPKKLAGQTLGPGLYRATDTLAIAKGLTLNAGGDPNAVFIFQVGTLLTASDQIILVNGAEAPNVFWQVGGSALLEPGSEFKGTVMAADSITIRTSATLDGRALALNGAITLDNNTITLSPWSAMNTDKSKTLLGVWGTPGNEVFTVGYGGTIWYKVNADNYWAPMNSGTDAYLLGVWGTSRSNVFAVGWRAEGGDTILHYDGSAWSKMASGTTGNLLSGAWGRSSAVRVTSPMARSLVPELPQEP